MKTTNRWFGILVALGMMAGSTACLDQSPSQPSDDPTNENNDRDPRVDPTRPSEPGEAPFVRISGEAGAALAARADGLVTAEVRVGNIDALRTLGVVARVEGASIVEWERHDEFLKSAGGQVIALESKVVGDELRMVLGTTQVVSNDEANGALLATLVLRPTSDAVRVSVRATGDHLGAIDGAGSRIELETFDAALVAEGN